MSKSFAFLVTRERGFGLAVIATLWIVFFSGREAVGDYITTIYDAYTGRRC